MKKRFTEEQIIGFLKEAEAGMRVKELCHKHGFSDASFYTSRSKYGGMEVSDAKRLKAMEQENARLKKLLAETMLDKEALEAALRKVLTPQVKLQAVNQMQTVTAVSERRACQLVGLSRNTLRYEPRRSAQNEALSTQIIELAQVRRRFGYRRIHALLRRDGVEVNHKRVYRLYSEAQLSVKRRKRRKRVAIPREPLLFPAQPKDVWSMDFVMDLLCYGRRIKILTIVDDCTKESVDLVADFGISGHYVTRILDQAARFRGYPKAIIQARRQDYK